MINVSENFKTAMTQPVKEIQAFINYDNNTINDSDDLISFKISCDSGLCKTAMRKLEAKYLGNHNVLGKWVKVGFGVRLPDGTFDLLDYGSFLVTELTETKDTETTSIVAYDKMVNSMTPYQKLNVEYPLRLIDYTRILCEACGLELENEIFGTNLLSWNSNIAVNGTSYINSSSIIDTKKNKMFYFSGTLLNLVNSGVLRIMGFVDYPTIEDATAGNYTRFGNVNTNGIIKINDTCNYIVVSCNMSVDNTITREEELANLELIKKDFMLVVGNKPLAYSPYNKMNDWLITATQDDDGNVIDLWENIDGITYRDIFVQIAQATASTCIIHNDKVYFKPLTDTGESLTYDNMLKLKLEALYGEINSVVLSRTPAEDNVFLKDESSVQTNGLTEFKIENNEIIDKDRENAITPIFDALYGVFYYPFETTTEGLGWYEIGDNITIVNDVGEEFKTSLFNYTITIDGSVKETLKTTAESKTQTQYQYATTITKQLKNTEIIVDKQNQTIKSLVEDVYEDDGVINKKFTSLEQDIEKFAFSVQNSGGSNLIKNSVMFAYDNSNVPTDWEIESDGELIIASNTESFDNGCTSGHSFTLINKTARQKVQVEVSTEEKKTYYTFSTKIKKGVVGNCYVKLYNSLEEHIIEVPNGVEVFYADYEITGVSPKENYYYVEFYGSADSDATFTDNMLVVGDSKRQWSQANGEMMNTQVNINVDGVLVKSSVYLGDYTVMSPLEFAGYSNVSGTMTKVFSLNRDVTKVTKLEAEDEIKMIPLKTVPITEGELQGWAFVPST